MKRARNRRYGKWRCVEVTAPLPPGRMQADWYVVENLALDPDQIPNVTFELERRLIRPPRSNS